MRKEPMPITDFALNYKKEITLNYDQMLETHKALCARVAEFVKQGIPLDDDGLSTVLSVANILDTLIEEAVLKYEEIEASNEAKSLDDPNFMDRLKEQNDLPEDNPQ